MAMALGAEAIGGIYPMLYAFFGPDGGLDRGAVEAEVEACLAQGAPGLAVGGLASECNKLSTGQRRQLMEWVCRKVDGPRPVSVTVAETSAEGQIEMVRAAQDAGASWVVLQPPPVTEADDEALIAFFSAVAEQASVPVGIQNAPQFLGTGLSDAGLIELNRRCPRVCVVKAEGPPVTAIAPLAEATGGSYRIFNGRNGIDLTDSLRAGCHGIIPGVETCDRQVEIFELMAAGQEEEADRRFKEILPLLDFLMLSVPHLICYGKRLAARRLGLGEVYDHQPADQPTAFGLSTLNHWARDLGSF